MAFNEFVQTRCAPSNHRAIPEERVDSVLVSPVGRHEPHLCPDDQRILAVVMMTRLVRSWNQPRERLSLIAANEITFAAAK